MRITKLGRIIVIHPVFILGRTEWELVSADKNGNWKSGSIHSTKEDAEKERRRLFKRHAQLHREREQMSMRRNKRVAP